MNIRFYKIKIKDLVKGYTNKDESGVWAYDGKLNIRPAYQREFCYDINRQQAVIKTIIKGYPINTVYFYEDKDDNGKFLQYSLLDGQQRLTSICRFMNNEFSIDIDISGKSTPIKYAQMTGNLNNMQKDIENYEIMTFICSDGTDREKLDWFQTINTSGLVLNAQELRNAVYVSEWLNDAKKYFSKSNCPAYVLGKDYINGNPIRQDIFEKVLGWAAHRDTLKALKSDSKAKKVSIEDYMANQTKKKDSKDLQKYYEDIINWVKSTFIVKRKEHKSVDWGVLYNLYHTKKLDANKIEEQISKLYKDSEVQKKAGIYEYILSGDEKCLNLRTFDDNLKAELFEKGKNHVSGKFECPICHKEYNIDELELDHIVPWSKGGKTIPENCQLLCKSCNCSKGAK